MTVIRKGTASNSVSSNSFFAAVIVAVLVMLASCADLNEPVATANSAIQSVDAPLNKQGQDKSTDDKPSAISAIENFTYRVADNQSAITLLWQTTNNYTYTIAKAANSDCDPLGPARCVNFVEFKAVSSPFTDTSISAGSTYYYWVLAQLTKVSGQQSASAFSSVDHTNLIVSDALGVALDFPDSVESANLEETPDITFLKNLSLLRTGKNTANISWQQTPELVVTVYGSLATDCDVLNASADCAEVLASERSASSPLFGIASQSDLDSYYFWVHAKRYVPLLGGSGQAESRLYGPMRSTYLANSDGSTRPAIKISETTTFDEHSLSVTFDAPANLVHQFASYNFYLIFGSEAADKELIERFLSFEEDGLPSLEGLRQQVSNSEGDLSLAYESMKFQDLRQLSTSELFVSLGTAQADTWYTVVLIAEENSQTYSYQASARKTLQRLRVNVQGTDGIWKVRDKISRAVHIAKKGSGFYYPSTSNWRNMMIDAELAFQDKQAYYFTGCAYYHDEPALGGSPRLFNNECHYAQLDTESGHMNTVLSKPLPVKIVFERKANALACQTYQELPANGYNRSRNYQLGAYENAICDHRIATSNSDGGANHFVMVYPNGEPTEIARSQVPQWFGGTQVPLYISGSAPLPAAPDGVVTTTVCSDLGEDQRCSFKEEIKVFRCNGYYSYELAQPTGCSVGYAWEESPVSALHRKAADTSR